MPSPRDTTGFADRLLRLRISRGLTQKTAAANAGVSENSLAGWERGSHTPKLWRAGDIARALGVPVAALFTDELVVAEVVVSAETAAKIRREGRQAAREAAERLALALEPVIYAAVTAKPVDITRGRRAKRRRTRAEVLAGIAEAKEAAARVRGERRDAIE